MEFAPYLGQATALRRHPLAVVLSCIDSCTPAELILDLGLGDIFSIRIAGNVTSPKVLGSMEYGCVLVGAKSIVVMGHTQCGAVTTAVHLAGSEANFEQATGCQITIRAHHLAAPALGARKAGSLLDLQP